MGNLFSNICPFCISQNDDDFLVMPIKTKNGNQLSTQLEQITKRVGTLETAMGDMEENIGNLQKKMKIT